MINTTIASNHAVIQTDSSTPIHSNRLFQPVSPTDVDARTILMANTIHFIVMTLGTDEVIPEVVVVMVMFLVGIHGRRQERGSS